MSRDPAPEPTVEQSLSGLVDSLGAAVLAVDRELRVRVVNDSAENWLGRSRRRLTGLELERVDPCDGVLEKLAAQVLRTERGASAMAAAGGSVREVRAEPWWVGGHPAGVVLFVLDPRPYPELEAPADVASLAAGLAHEVRNPLAALRGAAELLIAEQGANEYLQLIIREVGRVDALVARMMDLSRPLELRLEAVALPELLHELSVSARALARARGAAVEVEERYDPALPPLPADRAQLFEALLNLVKNSVEAVAREGGRVELGAGMAPARRRLSPHGRLVPMIRLWVRDNGPGLGTDRDRLFTPFFTTKSGGTGLGLLLVRRAVEAHGGLVSLRDIGGPGGTGTEAQVLLPLERE